MNIQDEEIRKAIIDKYREERMHRYIPISLLSEALLMFGWSPNPPVKFILENEAIMRSHANLIPHETLDGLVVLYEKLSTILFLDPLIENYFDYLISF